MDPSKDSGGHGDITSDAEAVFEDPATSLTGLNPNALYHGIVLPPTNFESVYDQRDNEEVLCDIRQVKSELENSVLGHTSQSHGGTVVLDTEVQHSSTNGFDPVAQVEVQNMLVLVDHQQNLPSAQHHQSVQLQSISHDLHQEQLRLDAPQEHQEQSHPIVHSIERPTHEVHSQSPLAADLAASPAQLQDAIPPLQMVLTSTVNQRQSERELLPPTSLQDETASDKNVQQPATVSVVNGTVGNEKKQLDRQEIEETTDEELRELSQAILRDNVSKVVTIKVEDRLPGESFMHVEVASVTEPESESPELAFCNTFLNAATREELATNNDGAEPLTDVVITSEIDDELNDLIKLKLKTFENLREDAASQLLATDALLAMYQRLLRKLSIPVLELGSLLEEDKAANSECIKKKLGSILCQLVMLNERVICDRRAKILTYLGKPTNLADGHRIPHRSGEALFGRSFIEQHHLTEMKRSRRKTIRGTANTSDEVNELKCQPNAMTSRGKRRRKISEGVSSEGWPSNSAQTEAVIPNFVARSSNDNSEEINEVLEDIEMPRRAGKQRRAKPSTEEQTLSEVSQKKTTDRVRKEKCKKETISAKRGLAKVEIEPHTPLEQSTAVTDVLIEFNSTSGNNVKARNRNVRASRKIQIEAGKTPPKEGEGGEEEGEEEEEESEEEEEIYDDDKDVDFPQPMDLGNDEKVEDEMLDDVKGSSIQSTKTKKGEVPSLLNKVERKMDNNCDHCDYIAEKRRQLVLHVKNVHPEKMIACDSCDKRFAFQISLWNHKNAMHLGAEHKCPHPQCTRSFKDEDKLRTHLFVHSTEKPFTCDICGRGCLTKVHLDSHVKVHERRDTQYCQTCNRYFGSNHTFRNHMKLHAGKKEWFCDICNAGFPIKPRLVLHKKIAHSDEQFVCDECGKGFKMKHILNDHKALIHSTRKAFVCEVCGVGFKLRSVLRRHMKTHSDERPHKCELCDKAFKVKSTLVEHRKTHTNEKPFLCEQCGVAFKRNAERRKHNCMNGTATAAKHVVMQVHTLSHDQSAATATAGHAQEPTSQLVAPSAQVELPQASTGHPAQLQVAVVTTGGQTATQHLVAHMPLQLSGAQMIQIMSPSALVSGNVQGVQAGTVPAGSQLMVQQVVQQLHNVLEHTSEPQTHSTGPQTTAISNRTATTGHSQFANFSVS